MEMMRSHFVEIMWSLWILSSTRQSSTNQIENSAFSNEPLRLVSKLILCNSEYAEKGRHIQLAERQIWKDDHAVFCECLGHSQEGNTAVD